MQAEGTTSKEEEIKTSEAQEGMQSQPMEQAETPVAEISGLTRNNVETAPLEAEVSSYTFTNGEPRAMEGHVSAQSSSKEVTGADNKGNSALKLHPSLTSSGADSVVESQSPPLITMSQSSSSPPSSLAQKVDPESHSGHKLSTGKIRYVVSMEEHPDLYPFHGVSYIMEHHRTVYLEEGDADKIHVGLNIRPTSAQLEWLLRARDIRERGFIPLKYPVARELYRYDSALLSPEIFPLNLNWNSRPNEPTAKRIKLSACSSKSIDRKKFASLSSRLDAPLFQVDKRFDLMQVSIARRQAAEDEEGSSDSDPGKGPKMTLSGASASSKSVRRTTEMKKPTESPDSEKIPVWPESEASDPCRCLKSHCLKRYCTCFAKQRHCSAACSCYHCFNRADQRGGEDWLLAYSRLAAAPPEVRLQGCRCSGTTRCLKRYCECYNANVPCTEFCICVGCDNRMPFELTSEK